MWEQNMTMTYLSAMIPASWPPMTPTKALTAPSHALLWKNWFTEETLTSSVKPEVGFKMIGKTEENPLKRKQTSKTEKSCILQYVICTKSSHI